DDNPATFSVDGRPGRLTLDGDLLRLEIEGRERLAFDVAALRDSLDRTGELEGRQVPGAALRLDAARDGWRATLLIEQLSWRQEGSDARGQEIAGQLLLAPLPAGAE
ncbi:hypothetical protein KDL67_08665, partial [bacterium]|nr:hypothetical protein [bacterium]